MKLSLSTEIDDAVLETAMVKALDKFPDFVLVTRCKDCKWFGNLHGTETYCKRHSYPEHKCLKDVYYMVTGYDYCSDGERKEDET